MSTTFALEEARQGSGKTYVLRPGLNRVGSHRDSHVCLPERGVSKRHALLLVRGAELVLEDLASKNGTFVRGRRVDSTALLPGDRVHFGPVALDLVRLGSGDGVLAIRLDLQPGVNALHGETSLLGETTGQGAANAAGRVSQRASGLRFPDDHLPGKSAAMQALYEQLAALADSKLPLLILGETGVGKEGIARIVHASSQRASGPYLALNCAAIPPELLEAELFGISRGVATGVDPRPGRLREADGGTLFLDEIGEMPGKLQAKLLRALQEREVQPVGGVARKVDVRVLAATNAELLRQVEAGRFRRDLYYRLAGGVLNVPPLRDRDGDAAQLIEHFLRRQVADAQLAVAGITISALEELVACPWPGNVRELEHTVARLAHLCAPGQPITSTLLAEAVLPAPDQGVDFRSLASLRVAELEKGAVVEALRRSKGNQSRAAPLLGLSREALRRRMARYGLSSA